MGTELGNAIRAAGMDAQYDDAAKRLVGNKIILAHILVGAVDEFKGMDPKDVAQLIEGEPHIGTVPIEPGLTNVAEGEGRQRIAGFNTEDAEVEEGLIRFDIIFYVRSGDGVSQVIVNLEIQREEPAKYAILNRAVFYVSRMISSQKERDFIRTEYNGMKRVFSIWLCLNMEEDSMNHIHLADRKVLGSYEWKGRLDLLNIIMIGIAKEQYEDGRRNGLHRMLGSLLSAKMPVSERYRIMEKEYGIPVDSKMKEGIGEMCNLSQGIRAEGRAEGEAEIVIRMHENGFTLEQIMVATGKSADEVSTIIEKRALPSFA